MTTDQGWEEYKAKYQKSYKDAKEEQMRRKLYLKSKKRVDEHNKRYEAQKEEYRINVSFYSDYTPKEFSEANVVLGTSVGQGYGASKRK